MGLMHDPTPAHHMTVTATQRRSTGEPSLDKALALAKARKAAEPPRERLRKLATKTISAADSSGTGAAEIGNVLLKHRFEFERHAPVALEKLRAVQAACSATEFAALAAGTPVAVAVGGLRLVAPIWAVGPMVGQCDAPFRMLCRAGGATLVYSEMLMAEQFVADPAYRADGLGIQADGRVPAADHPLVVQFAANTPEGCRDPTEHHY